MCSAHKSEPEPRLPEWKANGKIKRVLVPTDFSPCSAQAVRQAAVLARQCGAVITLFYVVDLNLHTPPTGPANGEKLKAGLWKEGVEKLDRTMLEVADSNVEAQAMIAEGLPAEAIAAAARQHDLIVIGQRRPKSYWRLFSRRTVEQLLKRAPCPVLVVGEDPSESVAYPREK